MTTAVPSPKSRAGCKHIYLPAPRLLPVGYDLLREESDALYLELWLAARALVDWAETPADGRADLTHDILHPAELDSGDNHAAERELRIEKRRMEALAGAPELASALTCFASLRRNPLQAEPRRLADTCFTVAASLEKRGAVELALRFAELSAALEQECPRRANQAARIARHAGIFWRSDIWYGRGVGLANEAGDDEAKIRAYLGWGTLHAENGQTTRARRLYGRAAWGAKRGGERWLSAMVHHDLLVMASTLGAFRDAEVYARRAFRYYPRHNIRLPAFAYDLARFFIRMHCYGPALTLLDAAVEKIIAPHEQAVVWGGLAWAAGGISEPKAYETARDRLLEIIAANESRAASALINLAYGARAMRDWDAAAEFGGRVLSLARRARGNGLQEERELARSLLTDVERRVEAPPEARLPSSRPGEETLAQLTDRFMRRLAGWRGTTWRRKDQHGPEDRPEA